MVNPTPIPVDIEPKMFTIEQLLGYLIIQKGVQPAPNQTTYHTEHVQANIGIGPDHTATLTLSKEALLELQRIVEEQ